MNKVVSYLRVSTARQGASGLGLEAQRAAVAQFCQQYGYEVTAEYLEVESGRKNNRPQLKQALAHAKRTKATLLIAKLDRLARNVFFISGLMESGAEFRACDMPEANKFMLHIMAAVAENEAAAISARTKAALAAAKARGTLLGGANPACRNLTQDAARKGADAVRAAASEFNGALQAKVHGMKTGGMSLRAIAAALNAEGLTTRKGSAWNPMQVSRVLAAA